MRKLFRIGSALLVAACFLAGLAIAAPVTATEVAGVEITFENGSGPLFNFTGYLPGDSVSSWVRAHNLDTSEKDITVWAENVANADRLGDAMQLTIKNGNDVLYRDSLTDFFNGSHVSLSTLGAYDITTYVFTLEFDRLAGNVYQGKTVGFDLAVNASDDLGDDDDDDSGDDDTSPDDDSDDANDDTADDDSSDDDTTDDDTSPDDDSDDDDGPVKRHSSGSISSGFTALLITNVRAEDITGSGASIKWDTNLDATSQVIVALAGSDYAFDPDDLPAYGYSFIYPDEEGRDLAASHNIALSGLQECQTYYYRVVSRATAPLPSISEGYWFATACQKNNEPGDGGSIGVLSTGSNSGNVLGLETEQGADDNEDPLAGQTAQREPGKSLSPLMAGSLWDVLGGIAGMTGWQACSPDVPWWLFLVFAVYPIYKSRSRFNEAKKTIDLKLKNFFNASGRAWIYSSLLPVGLAVWAYFAQRCLPWWPFLVLFIATMAGYVYDRRKAAGLLRLAGSQRSQFGGSPMPDKKPTATL